MTQVDLCGIAFSGTHEPINGLAYQRLIDWDGRPSARGGGDSIPGGQGVFARTQELRDSILITIEAAIITHSVDEYFAVKRRVENMPMFGEMRVDQGDGVWVRSVEVERINIPDARAGTKTKFTIDVTAPDPIRYRDLVTSGPALLPVHTGGLRLPKQFPWNFGTSTREVATVVNAGTVPVYPRIIVESLVPNGPVSADSLIVFGGPRRLEVGPFSGRLMFDSLERRAWMNGVEVTRQLIRRDWPVVPAGELQEFFFEAVNPSPNISLLVEYRIGEW